MLEGVRMNASCPRNSAGRFFTKVARVSWGLAKTEIQAPPASIMIRPPAYKATATDAADDSSLSTHPISSMTKIIFTESDVAGLRSTYDAAGQGHVFTFWDSLTSEQQQAFYSQLVDLDVARVNQIYQTAVNGAAASASTQIASVDPLPNDAFDSVLTAQSSKIEEWETLGLKLIAEGKVAVILMAGGQGTRLGSSAPKGCYDMKLPSGKTLFQLQAERILKLQQLARARFQVQEQVIIPWYIMTSGLTHAPTYAFFEQNNFFGLDKANIILFEQGKKKFQILAE